MNSVDAEIDAGEIPEAMNREPSSGQQCQCKSKFADDKRPAQAMTSRTGSRSSAFLERFAWINSRCIPSWSCAKQQPSQRGSGKRKQQNGQIQTELSFGWECVARHGRRQPAQSNGTDANAQHAANEREQKIFGN